MGDTDTLEKRLVNALLSGEDLYARERNALNRCHYHGQQDGYHESYVQSAHHPLKPVAFWLRHSLFVPEGSPQQALCGVSAVIFDGQTGRISSVQQAYPLHDCEFSPSGLDVQLPDAVVQPGRLSGAIRQGSHRIGWDLQHRGANRPLRILPLSLYDCRWAPARSVVSSPNSRFSGSFQLDGESVAVDGWIGAETHAWGRRRPAHYAWVQVAGFDNAPDVFLECLGTRMSWGPVSTPQVTWVVLRVGDRDFNLNGGWTAVKAGGRYAGSGWEIETECGDVRVSISVNVPPGMMLLLRYRNPVGAEHPAQVTRLASCRVVLQEAGQPERVFQTRYRAVYEVVGLPAANRSGLVL